VKNKGLNTNSKLVNTWHKGYLIQFYRKWVNGKIVEKVYTVKKNELVLRHFKTMEASKTYISKQIKKRK
jgi:hypothetical protein